MVCANKIYLVALCRSPTRLNSRSYLWVQFTCGIYLPRVIPLTGDVDQALVDYIEEWCVKRPLAARQFRDTLQKLQDETLGFNNLDMVDKKG